ncbi:ArdC-like ssDNA-binding domain-containing protein [Saliphagus sp. LR7]|uniref:ArdC-like ssDNA-binding domain-containing protein n=1 Tax=Saliphagus sp. LR7 TaxID=2282654 RepID=UPI000DF76A1D|nr:ArdC-like ssDNA-binding domain-containing protein [Saliphagus sp. LR7]
MSVNTESTASFDETETRSDEMNSTIEQWVEDLANDVDEAAASEEFQEWLDVQSRFHDYSHRNTLLIKLQCPEASRVAGYNTWRNEFDRYVQEGERAIWIWAPIITKQCPECENSPSYHDNSDCEYNETPPEEWSKGLVGFRPASVFDISQTEGEPLPDLETEATGDPGELVPALLESADSLGVETRIVPPDEWSHGEAKGVCKRRSMMTMRPKVEVKDRKSRADLASTLIHEYAHALLHFEVEDDTERSKREVEAEAVAYVVGRYFELDMSGSAFYLAAWSGDNTEEITSRLGRISQTAQELIDILEEQY